MSLPVFRPLPTPNIGWLKDAGGEIARTWREWVESLDRVVRAMKGLEGSATYNPPSLTNGSGATTTITVAGAAFGDFCMAAFETDLASVMLSAWVAGTDTVAVRFQNQTGGTVDLPSATLRVRVVKA